MVGHFPYTGGRFGGQLMERRRIVRVLAMSGAGLWTQQRFRAVPLLQAQDASRPELLPLFPLDLVLYSRLKELAKIETQVIQDVPRSTDTQLSYRLIAGVPAELTWLQHLLELRSERKRLELVADYLKELIEEFESAPNKQRAPSQRIAAVTFSSRGLRPSRPSRGSLP